MHICNRETFNIEECHVHKNVAPVGLKVIFTFNTSSGGVVMITYQMFCQIITRSEKYLNDKRTFSWKLYSRYLRVCLMNWSHPPLRSDII